MMKLVCSSIEKLLINGSLNDNKSILYILLELNSKIDSECHKKCHTNHLDIR
jgi:hypothetical protein